jgi:hypothetical protein
MAVDSSNNCPPLHVAMSSEESDASSISKFPLVHPRRMNFPRRRPLREMVCFLNG